MSTQRQAFDLLGNERLGIQWWQGQQNMQVTEVTALIYCVADVGGGEESGVCVCVCARIRSEGSSVIAREKSHLPQVSGCGGGG